MVLINCHSREYSRFNYGNELFFPIIISSGMLSLMSFVIDCAVFTYFFFFFWLAGNIFLPPFITRGIYWEIYLSSKMERKAETNPCSGPSSKPFIKKNPLNEAFINNWFTQDTFPGTCENLIHAIEDWRCTEAKDFVNYCMYFFILSVHLD